MDIGSRLIRWRTCPPRVGAPTEKRLNLVVCEGLRYARLFSVGNTGRSQRRKQRWGNPRAATANDRFGCCHLRVQFHKQPAEGSHTIQPFHRRRLAFILQAARTIVVSRTLLRVTVQAGRPGVVTHVGCVLSTPLRAARCPWSWRRGSSIGHHWASFG